MNDERNFVPPQKGKHRRIDKRIPTTMKYNANLGSYKTAKNDKQGKFRNYREESRYKPNKNFSKSMRTNYKKMESFISRQEQSNSPDGSNFNYNWFNPHMENFSDDRFYPMDNFTSFHDHNEFTRRPPLLPFPPAEAFSDAPSSSFNPNVGNWPKKIPETNPATDPTLSNKTLIDTIDTVKRKLRERKLSETPQENNSETAANPVETDSTINTSKKRIEHTKNVQKSPTLRKTTKIKPVQTDPPKSDKSKKAETLRKNILKQLFRLNNTDLRHVLSHPESSPKYNFVLTSLIRDTRKSLSRKLRNIAEKSLLDQNIPADTVQGKQLMQDAFLGHLETILDTDVTLDLLNMDPQIVNELSKTLQEDLMEANNEDVSVINLAEVMHEDIADRSNRDHEMTNFNIKEEMDNNWSEFNDIENTPDSDRPSVKIKVENPNESDEESIPEMDMETDNSNEKLSTDVDLNIVKAEPNPENDDRDSDSGFSKTRDVDSNLCENIDDLLASPVLESIKHEIEVPINQENSLVAAEDNWCLRNGLSDEIHPVNKLELVSNETEPLTKEVSSQTDIEPNLVERQIISVSSQTDSNIDNSEESMNNIHSIYDVIDRLKEIDAEIQNKMQKKAELYKLVDNFVGNDRPAVNNVYRKPGPKNKAFLDLENRIISHLTKTKNCGRYIEVMNDASSIIELCQKQPLPKLKKCSVVLEKLDLNEIKPVSDADSQIRTLDESSSILTIESCNDHFVVVLMDGKILYYDPSGVLIKKFNCQCVSITSVCVFEKENKLFVGSVDTYFRCFSLESGVKVYEYPIDSLIQSMCLGWNIAFIGTRDGTVHKFNINTNKIMDDVLIISIDKILAICATRDGSRNVLLVRTPDQITINDANTGLLLRIINTDMNLNPNFNIINNMFMHLGNIYCSNNTKKIQIIDFVTGEVIGQYIAGQNIVCLRPYKKLLFIAFYNGDVHIFKQGAPKPIAILNLSADIISIALSGKRIIIGYDNNTFKFQDIPDSALKLMS